MTTKGTPVAEPIFCRGCTYPLDVSVEARRCPECGRSFDPGDPGSYLGPSEVVIAGPTVRLVRSPILWLFVLMPFVTALDVMLIRRQSVVLFSTALLGLCAMIWCVQDSRERRFPIGTAFRIAVFAIPIVMVPVYLFRVRGRRATGPALLAILLMAGAGLVSAASGIVARAAGLG